MCKYFFILFYFPIYPFFILQLFGIFWLIQGISLLCNIYIMFCEKSFDSVKPIMKTLGWPSVLTCSSLIKLRSIWIYLQGNKIDDYAGIVEIFWRSRWIQIQAIWLIMNESVHKCLAWKTICLITCLITKNLLWSASAGAGLQVRHALHIQ